MNNRIGEGHLNSLEEGAVHQAMPQVTIEHAAQTSEEAQLATGTSDSDWRENPEPLSGCNGTQAGHSRDATSKATAFEPLNRSFETFFTRLSRTNERTEKSRRVFKKPRCYKD